MSIIISKNGRNAKKIDKSDFQKENYLQEYIQNNPDSIPIYELKEDKKLFVVKREFPTNAGPIDALAIDKDGEIYIVETKLYKNPDKRTVVAQVLDYGAALWKHMNDFKEFIDILNTETRAKFNMDFEGKFKDFFSLSDEEVVLARETMRKDLNDGNIKFVVLMDSIGERLKDLILYVNQNSQFDIYAVQLEYYKFEDYEIMIPKIFGAEVKKDIAVSSSIRKEWDEETFFQALEQTLEKTETEEMKRIYNKFKIISDKIRWGTGGLIGSYAPIIEKISPSRSLLSIHSNGKLTIKFNWFLNNEYEKSVRDKFKQLLDRYTKGLKISPNFRDLMINFELKEWILHAEGIIKAFEELKNENN